MACSGYSARVLHGEICQIDLARGQRLRGGRNQGTFDQMLKRLQLRLNEKGLIDLQAWMIDSTAVRATRASSGARKKGGLTHLPITLQVAVAVA